MATTNTPNTASLKLDLCYTTNSQVPFENVDAQSLQPKLLQGPLAWDPASLGMQDADTLQLAPNDIEEINSALAHFKDLGLDGDKVCVSNFPLPDLGSRLRKGALSIHNGRGLFSIRGLDPVAYSPADNVVIYLGIASYIGDKRGVQNKKGDMLTHVTDSKQWNVPQEKRHGIHTKQELPFHNDMGADTLGLQVRQCATTGGGTFLASAWTIYNDLILTNPAALQEMFKPGWPVQLSGKPTRYILSPLMSFNDGRLSICVDPGRLGPQPGFKARRTTTPSVSENQKLALQAFADSAKRNQVRVPLQAGDLLFFNNWALVHRREAYKDGEATSRHMVRLWLRNSRLGWKVPRAMATPWRAAFETPPTVDRVYPIEPMPDYHMPRYSTGSAAFLIDSEDEESDNDSHETHQEIILAYP